MYLNKLKKPNGDIYLSIREKYHVPGKGSRERTVESIGYLSVLKKTIDDPIGYYDQYAKKLTDEKNAERHQVVEIDKGEELAVGTNDTRNVGYGVFKTLYKMLDLDKFWNWKTRGVSPLFLQG